jgi:hypothetical protein
VSDYLQVQGYRGHTLVASGNTMTIDGKDTYDLTAVKAVAYQIVRNRLNGAYQGTDWSAPGILEATIPVNLRLV